MRYVFILLLFLLLFNSGKMILAISWCSGVLKHLQSPWYSVPVCFSATEYCWISLFLSTSYSGPSQALAHHRRLAVHCLWSGWLFLLTSVHFSPSIVILARYSSVVFALTIAVHTSVLRYQPPSSGLSGVTTDLFRVRGGGRFQELDELPAGNYPATRWRIKIFPSDHCTASGER